MQMSKYKFQLFSVAVFFIYIFLLYFHFDYIDKIGFGGRSDAGFYIEYATRIFDPSSDPIMFRPFFYLYGNLSHKIFGFNDYAIKISNLILFGLNGYLTFVISKKFIQNSFLSLIPTLLYFSNPAVNLMATTQVTTMLSTFLILLFIIFFFNFKNEIEEKYIKYSVYFALFAVILTTTHEELIAIVIINSLILYKSFFSKIKYFNFLLIQFLTFVSSWLTMFFFFGSKNILKNLTLQFLNVIPLDINFFIRSKYYGVEHSNDFSLSTILNFFSDRILPILPDISVNEYLILAILILFFYLYFKNKTDNKDLNNLNINLLIYFLISIVTIRAGARQFINYYPIFFIIFVFAVDYILSFTLRKKYKPFLTLSIFLIFAFITVNQSYPDGYKNSISRERIMFDYLKNKINNDNRILLLSTYFNAGSAQGPRYKIDGKYSENKSLSNLVYLGENAILFRNHLRFTDSSSDFKSFIEKNNIKFALFLDHYPNFIYKKKEYQNLINLFPNNDNIFEENLIDLKKDIGANHLALFKANLNELYSFSSRLEIQLVEKFSISKNEIDIFANTHLKDTKKIYLLEF